MLSAGRLMMIFNFRWIQAAFDLGMFLLGPILVIFALTLLSAVVYCYFTVILWRVAQDNDPFRFVHYFLAGFFVVNIYFNYLMAWKTSPGYPPDEFVRKYADSGEQDDIEQGEPLLDKSRERNGVPNEAEGKKVRFCKKCKKPKPARAHHCSVCKKCVLKMDHHCPWVAGCVGHGNYRYFWLFLMYLWTGCGYMCTLGYRFMFDTLSGSGRLYEGEVEMMFSFVLAATIFFAVGILFWWHVYLILTQQTTIEFYGNRFGRSRYDQRRGIVSAGAQYDLGWKENLKSVLCYDEKSHWVWWFLPSLAPPQGDGCFFPTRDEFLRKSIAASRAASLNS